MKKYPKAVYDFMEKIGKKYGMQLFYISHAEILFEFYEYITELKKIEALNCLEQIKIVADKTKIGKALSEMN